MAGFELKDNILYPLFEEKFENILCGFTMPYYGNMALTRMSFLTGKSTGENRKNLAHKLDIEINSFFSPHQIHSDVIINVGENDAGKGAYTIDDAVQGDACITDKKNVLLLVTWADCIPVLLYDHKKKRIAAIHAGWKGTYLNIIEKTITCMEETGSETPDIISIIGPGIRNCCYEVGHEFREFFGNYDEFFRRDETGIYFDLAGCVFKKCIEAGISQNNIVFSGKCTSCSKSPEFFSCRRQGKEYFEGQAAFIYMI